MSPTNILIPEVAFRGVTCTFCGLALVGATARTVIRFHTGQRRIVDDALFLFSCVCLVSATAIVNVGLSPLYQMEAAQPAQGSAQTPAIPLAEVSLAISRIQDYTYPFGSLIWGCVFAVKFCYLYFFRLLIDRQRAMVLYWRTALAVTAIAFVFNTCGSFISCPRFGQKNLLCENSYYIKRTLAVEATTIGLDIITDLMILVIPPMLMWNVKIRLRQKLGIGFFLSLSVFMIVIAIVRISRVHASDFETWAIFWQHFEGCIAVLMVSLTAFRTLFVSKTHTSDQQRFIPSYSYKNRHRIFKKQSERTFADDLKNPRVSVAVPSATLTDMRTFIGRDLTSDNPSSCDEPLQTIRDLYAHSGNGPQYDRPFAE
ncbi:hypothetical protein N7G274_001738 [Stereocaulon virgatum]|uniref:Rhodopsin domain-containing protein n=1 Tax=Stereocaulon virgatum TaxID=373712 RepID=A0ABR4ANB6_9LECA